ncbi:MAG: hypothetical protein KGY60_04525 [Bacteroidales bacterium]|nr:hypothetical protein [Bacteroidales bacterium]
MAAQPFNGLYLIIFQMKIKHLQVGLLMMGNSCFGRGKALENETDVASFPVEKTQSGVRLKLQPSGAKNIGKIPYLYIFFKYPVPAIPFFS